MKLGVWVVAATLAFSVLSASAFGQGAAPNSAPSSSPKPNQKNSRGSAPADDKSYRPDFACSRGPLALRVGKSLSELRGLGPLKSETKDPKEPDLLVLKFEGLEIGAVFAENSQDRGVIDYVVVTSPNWDITGGLRVGATVSSLEKALKRKLPLADGKSSVCGDTDCAVFSIKNRRVQKINYQCYTG